ncbi:MAG TPA: hypothetical protein VG273_19015, partial [Bryobacteraceae bacterium]|nr:hypothetical protein [Bryobacteraceae bacterium]
MKQARAFRFLQYLLPFAGITAVLSGQTLQFVGSAACKSCHPGTYERWSKTRMANVIRDPKIHPDAILPDLSKPDPLV